MRRTQYPKVCRICGAHFIAKGANAKYCPSCALEQKKANEDNRWKRKQRQNIEKRRLGGLAPEMVGCQYDEMYRKELGLSQAYYDIFRELFPKIYASWIKNKFQQIQEEKQARQAQLIAQTEYVSKADTTPLQIDDKTST